MIGMMMSLTSELTMAPKAAPMITATARSTTLPFIAKSRNSFSIGKSPFRSSSESIDQSRMHHRAADGRARRLGNGDHRQAQPFLDPAKQRKDRKSTRL